MDISIFSPKSQALTLTTTCSSPPPLTWLNPSSSLHPIRRQFLLLRPQTPPPRRKCNSLGLLLHTRSPQFLVKASLRSPPNSVLIAVVVALATFAAFSLAYLNHFLQNRRKNSSKQVSDSKIRGTRQLGSDAVDDIIENQIVRISSGENESLMMEIGGSNQVSEERTEQETTFVPDCTYLTETSVSIGADSFVSPQECPPFMLSDSGGVQPHRFATKMSELQLGKEQKDIESCESSVLENDAHAEVSVPTVSYVVLTESVREEQFACGRASQSVLKSPANLEFVKAISSHASPLNGYSLSSLKRDTEPKGPELSLQEALQTAEHVEGKIRLACHREGPSHKIKARRRSRNFPGNNERRNLMQVGGKNMLQFPYPNGKHANYAHDVSEQLHSYNRLIRQGRISDCIDLLEDMERKDLLDMDKVYHARFFNVCKSQKAIKEAFRFFKLVPNPTLSTFNMLMSVCASSKDSEGAFQVLRLVQEAGLKADCKLYTTLITTCAKSGKVDAMFEVFHEMVNAGIEPNVHTYGALIDGCAKAGQVAKAFGAYGIMRSKNVKPDRVVFNALITACGQSGAVDRAFDVLAEMNAEVHPVDPDHITIGALMKACANAGQVDRAREVYKMIHKYDIKGTPEVYTIAINCCSQTGDWEFACSVYDDMTKKGVIPDEVFLSALIDFAGHAGKVEAAFEILQEAKNQGISVGIISYSSLMGACSNAKNWQKALELYKHMKSIKLKPTVSTMNALITALCKSASLSHLSSRYT